MAAEEEEEEPAPEEETDGTDMVVVMVGALESQDMPEVWRMRGLRIDLSGHPTIMVEDVDVKHILRTTTTTATAANATSNSSHQQRYHTRVVGAAFKSCKCVASAVPRARVSGAAATMRRTHSNHKRSSRKFG